MTDFYLKTNHATSLSMNWSWLAPQTAMSKDDDLSDHSRSGKARLDHRILVPGEVPPAMAHPQGSAGAAGTAAAAPAQLLERMLTRCAMTRQSPTW